MVERLSHCFQIGISNCEKKFSVFVFCCSKNEHNARMVGVCVCVILLELKEHAYIKSNILCVEIKVVELASDSLLMHKLNSNSNFKISG